MASGFGILGLGRMYLDLQEGPEGRLEMCTLSSMLQEPESYQLDYQWKYLLTYNLDCRLLGRCYITNTCRNVRAPNLTESLHIKAGMVYYLGSPGFRPSLRYVLRTPCLCSPASMPSRRGSGAFSVSVRSPCKHELRLYNRRR